jgi:hypothetical protein
MFDALSYNSQLLRRVHLGCDAMQPGCLFSLFFDPQDGGSYVPLKHQ